MASLIYNSAIDADAGNFKAMLVKSTHLPDKDTENDKVPLQFAAPL